MGRRDQNNKSYPKVCVICSTQNQMVNYIPLKMEKKFTFETIYNITVAGSTYFNNATWDKNLKATLNKTFEDISLQQSDTHSVAKILENKQLESLKTLGSPICWNITGGQRTILLAIMEIIKSSDTRNHDVICYLEGNNNQMYISDIHHQKADVIDYSKEEFDLDITKALKLGGFKISEIKGDENHIDENSLKSFITEYKNTKNGLRDLMIQTNKTMNESDAITKLQSLKLPNEDAIKTVIKWGYTKNKSTPFGYILEEMTHYLIKQSKYYEDITELKTKLKINVRLYNDEKISEINNTQIDEFDVLLLTKNGKLIVFECKSGSMHPDIAKSTKYSTYATSGVYGLPILITPLLQAEIPPKGTFQNLGDTYSDIKASASSALRAGLEVWGIDKIEEHLKKYIG
jgi:hypothetical protein